MTNKKLNYKNQMNLFAYSITFLFGISLKAQEVYVNKDWDVAFETIGEYKYVSSVIDNNGNHLFVGNKKQNQNSLISFKSQQINGNISWAQISQNLNSVDEYGTDIAVDAANNVYISAAKYNGANYDYFIAKYNSNGSLIWQKFYNGTGNGDDVPSSMVLDNLGNIYVTGASYGSNSLTDFATLKLNNNGTIVWTKRYDFNNKYEAATDIIVNQNGQVVVCGASANNMVNSDYLIISYNATNGNQINLKRHNTPGIGFDIPVEMVNDNIGNIYLTGISDTDGNKDIKTISYNSTLQQVNWVKYSDYYGLEDVSGGLALDNIGNLYVTGHSKKSNNGHDLIIEKINKTNGQIIWNKKRSALNIDQKFEGKKIKTDQNNNVYIVGEIQEDGVTKIVTSSYNINGNLRMEKKFSKPNSTVNKPSQILIKNNDIYISGISESSFGSEIITVKYSITQKPNEAVFVDDQPSHIKGQLLIRFDKSSIKEDIIYKKDIEFGNLEDFVKPEVLAKMEMVTKLNWKTFRTFKVYRRMTPADATSISRLGEIIKLEDFWATLSVFIPENSNDLNIIQNLNTLNSEIQYTERNFIAQFTSVPNDLMYLQDQTGLTATNFGINVENAWNKQVGQSYVKVGVYDSGINWDHEDFGDGTSFGTKIENGWDYLNNTDIFSDTDHDIDGHGSACAGIIGAIRNNGKGIAGIAGGDSQVGNTGCKLYSLKISNGGNNFISTDDICSAIVEGSTYNSNTGYGFGLHIQNHSWAGDNYSINLNQAVKNCYRNNCVFVTASGNYSSSNGYSFNETLYPPSLTDDWVINVGAFGVDGLVTNFSIQGNNIDVVAPGVKELFATIDNTVSNDTYDYNFDGTSFAAPHVAGVSALLYSEHNTNNGYPNNLAPEDVEVFLQNFSTDIYPLGYDQATGHGRIDANLALEKLALPEYFVKHSGGQNSPSQSVLNNTLINVANNFNGVAAGNYFADRYQVTSTFIDIFPPSQTVLSHWPRNSSSIGVSPGSPITGDTWFTYTPTISQNVATVSTTTYCWHINTTMGGQLVNKWIPAIPSELRTAYSLYVHDNAILGIEEKQKINQLNVFPNPSSGEVNIEYFLSEATQSKIELMDLTGRILANYTLDEQSAGNQSLTVNINNFSNGVYIVNLIIGDEIISKRIVKN